MLMKSLITTVLLTVALASNGAGPAAASGQAARIRFRQFRATTQILQRCVTQPGEPLRSCVRSFIKLIHCQRPVASVSKTSMAACRSRFGIEQRSRLTPSRRLIANIDWPRRKLKSTQPKKTFSIKTEYPNENQNFRSDERRYDNPAIVEYTLTVPRKAMLESVELVNGSLDIDGVEGNVKASSINGRLLRVVLQAKQSCRPSMDHCRPRLPNSTSRSRSLWVQLTET